MKKIAIVTISILLLMSGVALSQHNTNPDQENLSIDTTKQLVRNDASHTVFAEYATTTWCPNCPTASTAIYEVSQETNQPFTYVTLVSDINKIARERSKNAFFNVAIPSVYFDGGYQNFIGNEGTINATKETYENLIQESLNRRSIKNIDLETEATWNGNAELSVQVTITNNGILPYIGLLKTYVCEIESRWNDYAGEPYHNALLDFAIDTFVFLMPQQTTTFNADWDGKNDHEGITYANLTQENTLITSAIFNIVPHYHVGFRSPGYTQRYLGFYADQADSIVFN